MARGEPGEQGYTPEVSPEVLPRKITPEIRKPPPAIRGVEELGSAIERKYAADMETYAGNELTNLRLGMTQAMEAAKANAAPGAEGYTAGILNEFDQRAKQYDLSNGYLARAIGPGLNHLRAQFGEQAMAYEAAAGLKYRADSAHNSTDALATIAAQHPDQAADLVGQALKQVRSSRLGPEVELEEARYAQSAINKSAVIARIGTDPYKTMQELLNPEQADVTIQGLKPAERETLLSHADAMLHQRVADAERLEQMRERDERQTAASTLTSLIVKSQSPEGLTNADVLKVAPVFRHEPQALSAALALASGKSVDTDPHVYLPLLQRAQAGEDVSADAMAGVGKTISKDDAVRLLSIGDRGLPNAHKQALDDIDGYFKQGLFDKYDPSFNAHHVDAKNQMLDWLRSHPQATPAEASHAARDVALATLPVGDAMAALEQPRFFRGNFLAPDINATISATREAELAHRISHDEAVHQMALIAQWAALVDRSASFKAQGATQ